MTAELPLRDPTQRTTILVVSENPELIHLAHERLGDRLRVIGCLGPANSPCNLESRTTCPLAGHASLAIVDTPSSGVFHYHRKLVSATAYAEDLQRAHPHCTVILCGAPKGSCEETGNITTVPSTVSLLKLLEEIADIREHVVTRREST